MLDMIIIVGPISILAFFLITINITTALLNRKSKSKIKGGNSNKKIKKVKKANRLYSLITKIPFIGKNISELKNKLYLFNPEQEEFLRYKAITYYFNSWAICLIIFLISLVIIKFDIFMSLCFGLLFLLFLRKLILNNMIGDDSKFLIYFKDFIKDVNHFFSKNDGMVNEAIYDSYKIADNKLMEVHGKKMYEALKDESKLKEYTTNSLNRFLKLFVNSSYLSKEFGDKKIDGKSIYKKNNNYIKSEVVEEIRKRRQLKYRLQSLTLICIIPVFTLQPLQNLVGKWFNNTDIFYKSGTGTLVKFLLLGFTMICYIWIEHIKSNYKDNRRIKAKNKYWENDFLKFKIFRMLVNTARPKFGSAKYLRREKLINDAGSYMKIDFLYLRRLIAGFLCGVLTVGLLISINKNDFNAIVNNYYAKFAGQNTTYEINGEQVDTSTYDKEIIVNTANDDYRISNKELVKELMRNGITNQEVLIECATRIQEKLYQIRYNSVFIYFKCMLGFICSFIFGFYIPIITLQLEKNNRYIGMGEEVSQFKVIILILKNHDRTSIKVILEWLESFADIFQPLIKKCLNNLQKGEVKALEELQKDAKFKPFVMLIDNIIMAKDIKLKDAFEELEGEKEEEKFDRREDNYRIIIQKTNLAKKLGFAPTYAILAFYIIIPLVWTGYLYLNTIMQNTNLMQK
jgi:hypothetical protein